MNKKRIVIIAAEVLLLIVLIWQGSKVVRYLWDTSASRSRYTKIEEMVREQTAVPVPPATTEGIGNPAPPPADPDAAAKRVLGILREQNEDSVAWIEINALDIRYPVVQGTDNFEYLYKSFDGQYSVAGTVYLDTRNRTDFTDRNIVLYGHHMKDGSMFHNLSDLRRKDDWKEPVEIVLYTERGEVRWRVYSVYSIDEDVDYRSPDFPDEDAFRAFLDTTKRRSEKDTGVDPNGAPSVLTLSTCSPNDEGQRIVVQAVPIEP